MEDFYNKLRERWQQKRKKARNWTGLLFKVLLLVAVLLIIQNIVTNKNIDWSVFKPGQDSVQTAPGGGK